MEGFIISEFTSEVGSTIDFFFFTLSQCPRIGWLPQRLWSPYSCPSKKLLSHIPDSLYSITSNNGTLIPSELSQSAIMVTDPS